MAATKNLYHLIQSLSPSERRYVQIFAQKHVVKDQNRYLALYKYLCSLSDYDEEAIKLYCQKKGITKNFSAAKTYLYKKILESMRQYAPDEHHDQLSDLKFLYRKGLKKSLRKLHASYKKQLLDSHGIYRLFDLIQFEKKVLRDQPAFLKLSLEEVFEQERAILADMHFYNRLRETRLLLVATMRKGLFKRTNPSGEQVEETVQKLEQELKDRPLHPLLHQEHLILHTYYHTYCEEFDKAKTAMERLLPLIKSDKRYFRENFLEYVKLFANYLGYCIRAGELELVEQSLPVFDSFEPKYLIEEAEVFNQKYFITLAYFLNSGRLNKSSKLVEEIEPDIMKYRSFINPTRRTLILYNAMIAAFLSEDYHASLSVCQKILHDQGGRNEHIIFARFLNILLLLKIGNTSKMDYHVRYFKKSLQQESQHNYHKLLIQLAEMCRNAVDDPRQKEEMCQLILNATHLNSAQHPGLGELRMYAESRLKKVTMAQVYRQEVLKS